MPYRALVFGALGFCVFAIHLSVSAPSKVNVTQHIFFGEEALVPVPYVVSIQLKQRKKWGHQCGGSIISSNYVLTAAHCLVDDLRALSVKKLRVLAGTNSQRMHGSHHRVVSFKIHPQFFENYDIAVVKVSPNFIFNQRNIAMINFESTEEIPEDTLTVVYGWGLTDFGYPVSLQRADMIILSQDECEDYYDELVQCSNICAVGANFAMTSWGDSGGPLVIEKKSLQIGVLSFGSNSHPDVYARVSVCVEWIKSEIAK